jgi:alpha-L-fucosidase
MANEVPMNEITKDQFDAFNKVREGGKYNMVMEAQDAAEDADLNMGQYWAIIKNYTELQNKFYPKEG